MYTVGDYHLLDYTATQCHLADIAHIPAWEGLKRWLYKEDKVAIHVHYHLRDTSHGNSRVTLQSLCMQKRNILYGNDQKAGLSNEEL